MASYNLGLLLVDKGQIDGADGAVEAFKQCLRNKKRNERGVWDDRNDADARSMLAECQYSESDSD